MHLIGTYQRSAFMLNFSAKTEYVRLNRKTEMEILPKRYLIEGRLM